MLATAEFSCMKLWHISLCSGKKGGSSLHFDIHVSADLICKLQVRWKQTKNQCFTFLHKPALHGLPRSKNFTHFLALICYSIMKLFCCGQGVSYKLKKIPWTSTQYLFNDVSARN